MSLVPHPLRLAWTTLLPALAIACLGCTTEYEDLKVFLQAHEHDVAATHYRLEPPDIISLTSPTAPEINGETQRIRSDGKISLKLLGEVKVCGLTPRETAAKIEELLSKYYITPTVSVRVVSHESKHVYVSGQVSNRGAHPFTGRDTLLDLLSRAQPNPIGWKSQVKVIRPNASPEKRHVITVDVDKMMRTGDLQNNFLLQEGDMVYVPPTPLGWIGLRLHELLFPISPISNLYSIPPTLAARNDFYTGRDNNDSSDNNDLRRRLLLLR